MLGFDIRFHFPRKRSSTAFGLYGDAVVLVINNVMYCNNYYITSSTVPTIITCIFFLVLYNVVLYSLPGIFPLVGFFIKRNLKMKNPNVALCLFLCHGLHCKLKPERVYMKHNIVFDFLLPSLPFLLLFCFSILILMAFSYSAHLMQ